MYIEDHHVNKRLLYKGYHVNRRLSCIQKATGNSRMQDPASRDEKIWVRTHSFAKRRFHGRKGFFAVRRPKTLGILHWF